MQAEKPEWLTVSSPRGQSYSDLKGLFRELNLHTVCEEAHCPNVGECWGGGTATLMLMGDTCSRACRFCMVTPGKPNGVLDSYEPENVAFALSQMGLTYVVLTSVDRDDLPDGGASHFARTIRLVKQRNPGMLVEVLIPDFQGDLADLKQVVGARPDVIAHNIETTMALTPAVRDPRAHYWQSLSVLRNVKKLDRRVFTKSSIMVGLGETEEEVAQAMAHLRRADVDFLTVGQYLRPSPRHLRVMEYVKPDQFSRYRTIGEGLGFLYVASGPLVRSSYRAGEFFIRTAMEDTRNRHQSYMTTRAETNV
ncbi:MAG: lipoyl synthase [Nitrososphaerota archaeon]|nr:lipoyl synthase [Nitrososphaerota archaeon]MDG7024590.1 lipoyl synthase [Nitrososphaerota archaeon]